MASEKALKALENEIKVVWDFEGHVKQRLIDDSDREKQPVVNIKRRKDALGKKSDFETDALLNSLALHADEIFEPKRILSDKDWLKSYKEPG